jgi:hypothetical protein
MKEAGRRFTGWLLFMTETSGIYSSRFHYTTVKAGSAERDDSERCQDVNDMISSAFYLPLGSTQQARGSPVAGILLTADGMLTKLTEKTRPGATSFMFERMVCRRIPKCMQGLAETRSLKQLT